MRTNNKMKDSEAESKEWWEVVEEYFTKEMEKNWLNIELRKIFCNTNWKLIKRIFQISSMVVQQMQRYRARMRRMKKGPME
jgi:hypothetical protein